MTAAITLLRAVLTAAFLYYGLRKLTSGAADVAIYDAIGFGQWPRYVTGTVEVVCAIGLWVPGLQGFAALGLMATVMIGTLTLLVFTTLPFWHLILLTVGAAMVAQAYGAQIGRLLPRA
ncbi:DoxX-like family protein [Loktanella fryxellensis]|uniref:DoxX-like family protein n=1 Tax=Loktanella fryxellensis TaxID=245187 RepID=A0A1H8CX76_9RHOB|nr:DoxX family protein [Loktanella fryxellensis]SEM99482.1 DoxX-like family protein [Loktanella fryxellensis]